jgi:hypothetical protein
MQYVGESLNIQVDIPLTTNNMHNIDYEYAYFRFDWSWIKNKQIFLKGNNIAGMLIITDSEGKTLKVFGFERIL